MAILVNSDTKVIVQGITGHQGTFHTESMLRYGTKIVAGVTPGRGGKLVHEIPVYDSVREAVINTEATASIIFVPSAYTKDAVLEVIASQLSPIIIITEHVPLQDEILFIQIAKKENLILIGPNCPGIISPGMTKIGIMPDHIFSPGQIGMISRSGTLTYEIAAALSTAGIGQSTAVGIGGDPVIGFNFVDALSHFERDNNTNAIVLVGEIGGNAEELAAAYIAESISKPVVAYIGGRTAPPGKRMGHAGAIMSGNTGAAQTKIKAFSDINVPVAEKPSDIPRLLKAILKR